MRHHGIRLVTAVPAMLAFSSNAHAAFFTDRYYITGCDGIGSDAEATPDINSMPVLQILRATIAAGGQATETCWPPMLTTMRLAASLLLCDFSLLKVMAPS